MLVHSPLNTNKKKRIESDLNTGGGFLYQIKLNHNVDTVSCSGPANTFKVLRQQNKLEM